MEFILGVITGYVLTWPSLILLCVFGIAFESNENHGMAVLIGLITAVTSYFYFNLTLSTLILYIIGYLIIGFIWSFWRYKRYCVKIVAECNTYTSQSIKDGYMQSIHPSNMVGRLTSWILIWPFSILENASLDVIAFIQVAIKRVFSGIYQRIFEHSVKSILPTTPLENTYEK